MLDPQEQKLLMELIKERATITIYLNQFKKEEAEWHRVFELKQDIKNVIKELVSNKNLVITKEQVKEIIERRKFEHKTYVANKIAIVGFRKMLKQTNLEISYLINKDIIDYAIGKALNKMRKGK